MGHLKGLANLTMLHLDSTQISDAGVKHLSGLTNLYYLNLGGSSSKRLNANDEAVLHVA